MSEWRDIESAPKDGHRVIVSGQHKEWPGHGWVTIAVFYMGRWVHDLPATSQLEIDPTHWMPLPRTPHLIAATPDQK